MSVFEVGRTISESTGGKSISGNRFFFTDDSYCELGLQRGTAYNVRVRFKGATSGYFKLTMIGHRGYAPNAMANSPFCYIVEALPQYMGVRSSFNATYQNITTKSFEDGIEAQHLMGTALNAGDLYPTVSCFQYTDYTEIILRVMNQSNTLESSDNRSNIVDTTATDHSAALTKHYAGNEDTTVAGQAGEMGGDAIFFTAYIEGYSYDNPVYGRIGYGEDEAIFTSFNRIYGGRGIVCGGGNPGGRLDEIDYVAIGVLGNGVDFGNLTQGRQAVVGMTDGSRGIFSAGYGDANVDTMDYITFGTLGNAKDWGEVSQAQQGVSGISDGSRAVLGGLGPPPDATSYHGMDFVNIQTRANPQDFGEQYISAQQAAGTSNGSRGIITGGQGNPVGRNSVLQYFSIGTLGNTIEFGNISAIRYDHAATSDGSIGMSVGGFGPSAPSDPEMDYFNISHLGNAVDFGDLLAEASYGVTATSDGCRGLLFSDASSTNVIQHFTITTRGNGVDFGDMQSSARYRGSSSGD